MEQKTLSDCLGSLFGCGTFAVPGRRAFVVPIGLTVQLIGTGEKLSSVDAYTRVWLNCSGAACWSAFLEFDGSGVPLAIYTRGSVCLQLFTIQFED